MQPTDSFRPTAERRPARTLKIENDGDTWKGHIRPKIRLMGRWLERAGFKPGTRVHVTCVAPGLIELRSFDTVKLNETKQISSAPDRSV